MTRRDDDELIADLLDAIEVCTKRFPDLLRNDFIRTAIQRAHKVIEEGERDTVARSSEIEIDPSDAG
jgi:hypothetical protein